MNEKKDAGFIVVGLTLAEKNTKLVKLFIKAKELTHFILQESEIVPYAVRCVTMTNTLILVIQEEHVCLIDANSLEFKQQFKISDSLSLGKCLINKMCFTECYDKSDKNMFLCTIEILPDELDKIKYKSMYDQPGFGTASKKGEYFWISRLKLSDNFDSIEVYEPEDQSIVF